MLYVHETVGGIFSKHSKWMEYKFKISRSGSGEALEYRRLNDDVSRNVIMMCYLCFTLGNSVEAYSTKIPSMFILRIFVCELSTQYKCIIVM